MSVNSSVESAAREQWMVDAARDVAAEIHFQIFSGGNMDSVVSANHPENAKFLDRRAKELAPIIARHYAAREQEQWIPVSERLPRASGEYEVWVDGTFESGGVPHAICPFPFYSKCCKFREDVTHWRPLPAAPFAAKGETDAT